VSYSQCAGVYLHEAHVAKFFNESTKEVRTQLQIETFPQDKHGKEHTIYKYVRMKYFPKCTHGVFKKIVDFL
jgi:hypothetical protein